MQTKLLSGLKDNQQENYFRQKPDKKQKSMIVMNIETQCSSNTAHKGIRSMSFLTYNNKSQTKTMKDLSKKKFAGTSNVFDSIQYSQRKTPNFYDRPMFSNLSRNTPIDKYKNKEGIKGRLMRGQYSSSHLQNNSVCSGFDLLKDIKQNLKDDKFKNNSVLKPHDSTLVKEYCNEYYNLGSTQESLKDINSIENFSEDNGNISKEKSIISIQQEPAELCKAEDKENSILLADTNNQKIISKVEKPKESTTNSILRGIQKFFSKSTYLCKCTDDVSFKCCETAGRWIIITERSPRDKIDSRYYEEEYLKIYDELHSSVKKIKYQSNKSEMNQHLENRRVKIEENKTQIIKDINRTFNKSTTFGEGTEGQKKLMDVLEVISFKYTGIGYVQGMNFLVAALLYHSSPAVTLGLMSHLLENLQLCDIYAENLVGVHYHNSRLCDLIAKHLPKFADHLKTHDVNIEIFTTQWIIDLFSHIIPLNEYYLLFDSFFKFEWSFIYRLVLTVLDQISKEIIELSDWSEILEGIKDAVSKINWKTAIYNANYNFAKVN